MSDGEPRQSSASRGQSFRQTRRVGLATGVVVLVVFAVAIATTLAIGGGDSQAEPEALQIVATTAIVGDLVSVIGGDRVEVGVLAGAGVDPHRYRPNDGDVARMRIADAVFTNGLDLEARMGAALADVGGTGTPVLAVTRDIPDDQLLRNQDGTAVDPHVWFSVDLWKIAARTVAHQLSSLDPDDAPTFEANLDAFLQEVDAMDAFVRAELASIPQEHRTLVSSHDAFRYFAMTYGFETRSISPQATDAALSGEELDGVAGGFIEDGIRAIFFESSVPVEVVQTVRERCRQRGWYLSFGGTLYSDSLGASGSPEGTYLGMMRANASIVSRALS